MKKAKFPFSLSEYKKGIYKVETRDGKPVRILCTDVKRFYPIEALILENSELESAIGYFNDGTSNLLYNNYDLFLIKDEFENGDIVHTEDENIEMISIFKGYKEDAAFVKKIYYHASYCYYKRDIISFESWRYGEKIRLATEEEKNMLFSKLKEVGKYWDLDKRMILDIKDKCPFKLDDKVLVRDTDNENWEYNIFHHYLNNGKAFPFVCLGISYKQCIPLNDKTKHLLGTNENCPEKYKIW